MTQGERRLELRGLDYDTTNGRMELLAVVEAVSALREGRVATLYTDAQFVARGWNEWLPDWKARGWRNAAKKPVAHPDLWKRLEAEMATREVTIEWVRGHNGDPRNEEVDRMAEAMAALAAKKVKKEPGLAYGFA